MDDMFKYLFKMRELDMMSGLFLRSQPDMEEESERRRQLHEQLVEDHPDWDEMRVTQALNAIYGRVNPR